MTGGTDDPTKVLFWTGIAIVVAMMVLGFALRGCRTESDVFTPAPSAHTRPMPQVSSTSVLASDEQARLGRITTREQDANPSAEQATGLSGRAARITPRAGPSPMCSAPFFWTEYGVVSEPIAGGGTTDGDN